MFNRHRVQLSYHVQTSRSVVISCLKVLVCLVFWSHSSIFYTHEDVTITCERLQILTCAQHTSLISSEGSLECHTYSDTGNRLSGHIFSSHNYNVRTSHSPFVIHVYHVQKSQCSYHVQTS